MSAQQELAALLRDAKPGERYSRPTRGAGPTRPPRGGQSQSSGRWAEPLPPWMHVELPELGGHACVVTATRERYALGAISTRTESVLYVVECARCGEPRQQQLTDREAGQGGETWAVLPCECTNNQGETR